MNFFVFQNPIRLCLQWIHSEKRLLRFIDWNLRFTRCNWISLKLIFRGRPVKEDRLLWRVFVTFIVRLAAVTISSTLNVNEREVLLEVIFFASYTSHTRQHSFRLHCFPRCNQQCPVQTRSRTADCVTRVMVQRSYRMWFQAKCHWHRWSCRYTFRACIFPLIAMDLPLRLRLSLVE